MAYAKEDRYYRSPSRKSAPPIIRTGPGVFGIGSFRPGQGGSRPVPPGGGFNTFMGQLQGGIEDFARWAVPKLNQYQDPQQALLDQLMELVNGGGDGGIDLSDYQAQARAEAAAEYDPQLAALKAAMENARRTTEINKGGIKSLYDTLAASYPADIRASKETFREAKRSERDISQEGRGDIRGAYQESQQDLVDMMRQLGIEEAGGEVLPGLAQDQAEALRQEAEQSTAEQRAYNRQGTAAREYYQEGPSLARMGGTQGQQVLTEQLNQFLLEQEAQRSQLQSQKALTYNALLGKYRSEGAQAAQQAQSQQFSQLNQLFNTLLAYKRFQREGMQPAGGQPSYEGLTGGAQVLGEMAGQGRGTELNSMLLDFIAEDLSGPQQASFPEAVNKLRQFAQERGLSSSDLNALTNALAAAVYNNYR